jgi:hypothetical protein
VEIAMRMLAGILLLLLGTAPAGAQAPHVTHARIDREVADYTINRDLTWTLTRSMDRTLLTRRGMQALDRSTYSFYPDKQAVEVVEAWVDQPDGTRMVVPASGRFTRPSAAGQSSPGFVASQTMTVLFPQLREGSRTHVVWHFTQKTPPLLGFNERNTGNIAWDTAVDETRITVPADVTLRWASRGAVRVEDTTEDGVRRIVAHMPAGQSWDGEPARVHGQDFQPLFLATSLPSSEAFGAIIHRAAEGRAAVTPEIAALAARIAGERTGLDAARAIHAWVTTNIRYVAVYLTPDDGYVPHQAAAVLKAGYGDCKDYAVLMQALLAARDIAAVPAVLDWGTQFVEPPLLTAFFANHEILYLPESGRFVNPTDRSAPFDALDRTLAGKVVVLVTAEGKVVHTPQTRPEDFRYRYQARLRLDGEGTMTGTAEYEMSPAVETSLRRVLSTVPSMPAFAVQLLAIAGDGGTGTLELSDPKDLLAPLRISASWESPMAVNPQGGEVYLRVPLGLDLHPLSEQRGKLAQQGARQTPALADAQDFGWQTEIALPAGTKVARLPPDVDVSTAAGRYTARYRAENGRIAVTRRMVVARNVVPAAEYDALRRLLYAGLVDTRAVLVLTPAGE